MRIAVNTRFLLKNKLEGIGWFTYETVKRLVENHPEHEFYFFFDRPFEEEFIFGKNVHPIVLFPPARHPVLYFIWFEYSVANALKVYKIDVFLSPDNFLTLRTKVPTVLVTHDIAHLHFPEQVNFFDRKYYQFFIPKFHKKATRIVTVSNYTKQDIVKNYGIEPKRIDVACNGCRDIFKPLNESERIEIRNKYSENQEYFFYVGAIQPRKNVHRLIEAFDLFNSQTNAPQKLLLGGRFAWKTGEVKTAFDNSSHQEDIVFLGYLSEDELWRIMASAFAFVYVSLFEGFGIPLLEAMNCDIPLITSDKSSLPEVAGNAGILVNPYDLNSIAMAMRQLLEDSHLYNQMIENGKQQRDQFSWDFAAEILYKNIEMAASTL
jgi:glycosyltransferase involved in cell wall biosynthesis